MCRNACPRTTIASPERWCPECQVEHEDYCEDMGRLALLASRNRLVDEYAPATDAEWLRYLDDIAPRVLELAECPMPGDEPGWFTYTV